jgi:hypothetical protein
MVIVHQSENASAGRLRARRRFLVLIYATAVVMCRGITCCSARFSFPDGLTLALTSARCRKLDGRFSIRVRGGMDDKVLLPLRTEWGQGLLLHPLRSERRIVFR